MQNTHDDIHFMQQALLQAAEAQKNQEVPVGAILVKNNEIIAVAHNQPISQQDPTAHAEIAVIRKAAKILGNYRLLDTTLYVTLEPCAMCLGAMIQARITRLVFGAYDPRAGAVESVFQLLNESRLNHRIKWQGGVLADECAYILKAFFAKRR
jgi:tRNA(adenine34) deaminase